MSHPVLLRGRAGTLAPTPDRHRNGRRPVRTDGKAGAACTSRGDMAADSIRAGSPGAVGRDLPLKHPDACRTMESVPCSHRTVCRFVAPVLGVGGHDVGSGGERGEERTHRGSSPPRVAQPTTTSAPRLRWASWWFHPMGAASARSHTEVQGSTSSLSVAGERDSSPGLRLAGEVTPTWSATGKRCHSAGARAVSAQRRLVDQRRRTRPRGRLLRIEAHRTRHQTAPSIAAWTCSSGYAEHCDRRRPRVTRARAATRGHRRSPLPRAGADASAFRPRELSRDCRCRTRPASR